MMTYGIPLAQVSIAEPPRGEPAAGTPENVRSDPEERPARLKPVAVAVNMVLVFVVGLLGWVVYQEVFSSLPSAGSVEERIAGTADVGDLEGVSLDGSDVVLTYDLTGEPYFDRQERYAEEFETVGRVVLDEFRRVERVHVAVLQGDERYEGLSVTDGFGVILSWF